MTRKTKRSNHIHIRLSDSEYNQIQTKAEQLGISMSEFVRRAAFRRELPQPLPQINLDAYSELGQIKLELNRMGINLNQIAKACNSSVQLGEPVVVNRGLLESNQNLISQTQQQITVLASAITNLKFEPAIVQSAASFGAIT
ncbi:MAG: MobC family plasmid mobilization relaxosome protein [Symploca sp. SIO3C6]|uniref:MobC family plasmid mobilization relaxosome protein n=1 Tax=Symploca sp. SIO1C4 TaxID=2607765 RepID=A0A6B3N5V8_9CYAN|nr:MobC family plasmid mobilization relaxosome protein [Symploca sp. SIO3C6]NER26960.1 MobC family plasmid mobilization relaxosome protein [Symploca sp. SIO1C4]